MIYWITTSLMSIFLLWSAGSYVFSAAAIDGFRALGFPDHFRIQLVVLKVLAAIILLVPQLPIQLKEWSYAGTGLFLLTAIVAHTAHKDPFIITLINLLLVGLLVISYIYMPRAISAG